MAKHSEKDLILDNLDREARKLGWKVSNFRLYGKPLYFLRKSDGGLLNDGWSMDRHEVLQAIQAERAAVGAAAMLNEKRINR